MFKVAFYSRQVDKEVSGPQGHSARMLWCDDYHGHTHYYQASRLIIVPEAICLLLPWRW